MKCVYKIADNIVSPLGMTTEQNYQALKSGQSALARYEQHWDMPEAFCASLFNSEQERQINIDGLTRFEALVVQSVRQAIGGIKGQDIGGIKGQAIEGIKGQAIGGIKGQAHKETERQTFDKTDIEKTTLDRTDIEKTTLEETDAEETGIDVGAKNVVFILGTTKGNISLLGRGADGEGSVLPGESARRICQELGITTPPIVACNACISGLSAIILGYRLLATGKYDHAIICGADEMSRFIVSGFQSLKALSDQPCRPFDMERTGLNLGEAAATMILSTRRPATEKVWQLNSVSIHNDAYHISTPSKRGDGAYLCLKDATEGITKEEIAFVNAHGTATLFNDQMESVAIGRAGLQDKPVNALKGYFGHTLGAAGVLETLLSMKSIDDHTLIGTRGFEELGVSSQLRLSADNEHIEAERFLKMISGFGGCNAALTASLTTGEEEKKPSEKKGGTEEELASAEKRGNIGEETEPSEERGTKGKTIHHIHITPRGVVLDGREVECDSRGKEMLTALYKEHVGDYPKFYKMDMLSRLGFIAAELLTQEERDSKREPDEHRGIVLFNRSSSIHTDRQYAATIDDEDNYYPSPSLFVYTLPNIVTGEIAIRQRCQGETSFYILSERDEAIMRQVVAATFSHPQTSSLITGWLDYEDEEHFEADLTLRNKDNHGSPE